MLHMIPRTTMTPKQLEGAREQIAVVGPDRLEIVCIHTNATMIQTWLEQNT
ncbi:hypothetical protein [Flindersiella endophytica]